MHSSEPVWILPLIAVAAVLIGTLISAIAARVRFSASRGVRWGLDILFFLPFVIPGVISWVLPVIISAAISPKQYVEPQIMIAMEALWISPLLFLCAIMGFRKIERETLDAAKLQGMGSAGIFFRIFLSHGWRWLLLGLSIGLIRIMLLYFSSDFLTHVS